ncbi:MAG: recombinase family protein [Pseudomonadota bacterium]
MKPCFGYIRVSTKEQEDGASLTAQKDAITGFASQNGLEIIQWFEELETASKTGRPLFNKMLQQLRRSAAEGLVIHRIDRSTRNFSDWARLDELSRAGIKVYFAADSLDFDSRGGRLMADIQMVLAADYSRNLSLEVKKGLYGRIKHGSYPFQAPIGYINNGKGALKTIDPIKGPLVKLAFDLYCSGEYSISSLTDEMARRGLTGFYGQPVVRRNMETMLRNPFYIGKMFVCGTLYDAAHEPLISAQQFHQVSLVKAGRAQKRETKHKRKYRRLLTCAECGKTMTGECQKNHIYYRCHTKGCANGTIREDRLEERLLSRLKRLQICPTHHDALKLRLLSWLSGSGSSDMAASLRLRISDAITRKDRLTDLLINGTISQEDFEVRKQNTEFELQRLREELKQIENQQKSEADLDDLLRLACNLHTLFTCGAPEEQRALLKNCTTNLSVRQGRLTVTPAPMIKELQKMTKNDDHQPSSDALGIAKSSESRPVLHLP